MFLVTVANILLTLLLPVCGLPNSRHHRMHLTHRYHPDRFHRHRILVRVPSPVSYGVAPQLSRLFFYSIEIVFHSNLTCRLVIGIREASRSIVGEPDSFGLCAVSGDSSAVFAQTDPRELASESTWVDLEARADPQK